MVFRPWDKWCYNQMEFIMQYYPDIPRICTALAQWGACMTYLFLIKKELFKKAKFWLCSAAMFAVQAVFLVWSGSFKLAFWLLCMLVAVGLMYVFIKLAGKISYIATGYCCVKAFLLAEFIASFEWQLMMYIGGQRMKQVTFWIVNMILVFVIYGAGFAAIIHLEKKIFESDYLKKLTIREELAAVGIAVAVFAFSNLSFMYGDTAYSRIPFTGSTRADIFFIRTLVDFGGLAILFIYQSRIYDFIVERELSAMNMLLKNQYEQYRNYQDSMEFIHIKYHDLKHQIAGLRIETDEEKRKKWLDAMEEEVNTFGNIQRTGNQVLDTILAAKIFHCRKNDISITCVADGKLLDFMHVMDICSIFGNALDNAVEHVMLIPDKEKRLIHVTVSSKKNFVFISVENYCDTPIQKDERALIKTTKADKNNHGFGLSSIRIAVEKYGGVVDFGQQNDWFYLTILIPSVQ